MKKITAALAAHVDAGKTTLAEAILHVCGAVRQPGRVDRGSAVMDFAPQERSRGITVFAGEAWVKRGETEIGLLDTPGHVDFSPETERVFAAADVCVLVISGLDGVQAHTHALWKLAERYGLPVIVFVSKMDTGRRSRTQLLAELAAGLSPACLPAEELLAPGEEAALLEESLLEKFLSGDALTEEDGRDLIRRRAAFPVLFGSGLREEGIDGLLELLEKLAPDWSDREAEPFSAVVSKISYDEKGTRLTHIKCLSGSIRPREEVPYPDGRQAEKAAQIRRYTGSRFLQEEALAAGSIGVLTGLSLSRAGDHLGREGAGQPGFFEPVMRYSLVLPEKLAPEQAMPQLKRLSEEDPSLGLRYEPALQTIYLNLMGPVQGEIVVSLIRERFGWDVRLEQGQILYKETVTAPVEGVGHYEPLRHYAEVHVALRPLPRGSGTVYRDGDGGRFLPGDMRRLILGQLWQKRHRGVLTGSPLTDTEITLLGGRFHEKHTEGGDFRESAWRAVRQGLMRAREQGKCALLEPYVRFEIRTPPERTGRVLSEIRSRFGTAAEDGASEGLALVAGRAPLACFQDFAAFLAAVTGGRGRLKTEPDGYDLCHNTEEVTAGTRYRPEADRENPPDSVFCMHGAGFAVLWDQVPRYMHLPYLLKAEQAPGTDGEQAETAGPFAADGAAPDRVPAGSGREVPDDRRSAAGSAFSDSELEAIMLREFGPIKRPVISGTVRRFTEGPAPARRREAAAEEYVVDGYNLIFAWEELKQFSEQGLDFAREQLERRLQNFAAFTGRKILLVFDGYRVRKNPGSLEARPPLEIVYTAENETADMHIERYLAQRGKKEAAVVVSNDNLIRVSTIRSGGLRLSCENFIEEYDRPCGSSRRPSLRTFAPSALRRRCRIFRKKRRRRRRAGPPKRPALHKRKRQMAAFRCGLPFLS
ncbi:MAG: NYN domain-containing protein [Lachnospiraceae bacterium]|nr:NYN domain-containing protein [Lachnospiraceae bacterium]